MFYIPCIGISCELDCTFYIYTITPVTNVLGPATMNGIGKCDAWYKLQDWSSIICVLFLISIKECDSLGDPKLHKAYENYDIGSCLTVTGCAFNSVDMYLLRFYGWKEMQCVIGICNHFWFCFQAKHTKTS